MVPLAFRLVAGLVGICKEDMEVTDLLLECGDVAEFRPVVGQDHDGEGVSPSHVAHERQKKGMHLIGGIRDGVEEGKLYGCLDEHDGEKASLVALLSLHGVRLDEDVVGMFLHEFQVVLHQSTGPYPGIHGEIWPFLAVIVGFFEPFHSPQMYRFHLHEASHDPPSYGGAGDHLDFRPGMPEVFQGLSLHDSVQDDLFYHPECLRADLGAYVALVSPVMSLPIGRVNVVVDLVPPASLFVLWTLIAYVVFLAEKRASLSVLVAVTLLCLGAPYELPVDGGRVLPHSFGDGGNGHSLHEID